MITYMLHHVNNNILKLVSNIIKPEDIMTFDDGLYSIYKFRYELNQFSNKKIIYITPSLVNYSKTFGLYKPKESMYNHFFNNNNSAFMNIDNIKELLDMGFILGAHGYSHDVVLHGFNNKKTKINNWRFYKYPHIKKENMMYYNISSCLSNSGYKYIGDKFIKYTEDEYIDRIEVEISMMREWFDKNLYIPDTFSFPFNSFNDIIYNHIKELFRHVYLDERVDICGYINNYY